MGLYFPRGKQIQYALLAALTRTKASQSRDPIKHPRDVAKSIRSFLTTESVPYYFMAKAFIALSGVKEGREPWEVNASCRLRLQQATKALTMAEEVRFERIQPLSWL